MDSLRLEYIDKLSQTWRVNEELVRSKFQDADGEFLDALTSFALFHSWDDFISALSIAREGYNDLWTLEVLKRVEDVLGAQYCADSQYSDLLPETDDAIVVRALRSQSVCSEEYGLGVGVAQPDADMRFETNCQIWDIDTGTVTASAPKALPPSQPVDSAPKLSPRLRKKTIKGRRKGTGPSRHNQQQTGKGVRDRRHTRATRSSQLVSAQISEESSKSAPSIQSHITGKETLNRVILADGWISEAAISGCLNLLEAALGKSKVRVIHSLALEDAVDEDYGDAMILAPIEINRKSNRHWTLVVIEPSQKLVRVLDSMPSPEILSTVGKIIQDFCVAINLEPVIHFTSPMLQLRANDCGACLLVYAAQICAGVATPLGQADITVWRKLIHELLKPLSVGETRALQDKGSELLHRMEGIEPCMELPTVDFSWLNNFMLSEEAIDTACDKINEMQTKTAAALLKWKAIVKQEIDELEEQKLSSGYFPSLDIFQRLQNCAAARADDVLGHEAAQQCKEASIRFHRAVRYLQNRRFDTEKLQKLRETYDRLSCS